MSNTNKTSYLSVVKSSSKNSGDNKSSSSGGGRLFSAGQVISPEEFTEEINQQVQKYIKNSGLKAVVAGALIADELNQDIRPLILYDGRLQILRYSDHLVSYDSNNLLKSGKVMLANTL